MWVDLGIVFDSIDVAVNSVVHSGFGGLRFV